MPVSVLVLLLVVGLLLILIVFSRRRARQRDHRRRARQIEGDRRRLAALGSWSLPPTQTGSAEHQKEVGQQLSDIDDLAQKRPSSDYRGELFRLIDRLCDRYLVDDSGSRDKIRKFFADKPRLQRILLKYSHLSAVKLGKKLSESDNVLILRRGIAAASIENLGQGWRESHQALTKLYASAGPAGIEPTSYFQQGVEISSDKNAHPDIEGFPTMRVILENLMKQRAKS